MEIAGIFSDNMVLQRDKGICIFGTGENGERIEVTIDGIKESGVVADGKWSVVLPSHPAGGPYELAVAAQSHTLVIHNVLYGEVWLAAGQSNMEVELQNAQGGLQELSRFNQEQIRYYNVPKAPVVDAALLQEEQKRCWHSCQAGQFGDMSAVAYFFAKKTYETLQVPIGIVDCYQGGTSVTCWLSEENVMAVPEGQPYMDAYRAVLDSQTEEEYALRQAEYDAAVTSHLQRVEEWKEKKPDITPEELYEKAGDYPWPPPMGSRSLFRPCGLYTSMVLRICPYGIRGVLYYQGEEDANRTQGYDRLLTQLILQYRRDWQEEIPFVIMQLPMFVGQNDPENYSWARLRLAQKRVTRSLPNTMLTVLLDLGELDNIHPVDKRTPGERLAAQVLEQVYQKPVPGSAMELSRVERQGTEINLYFDSTYGRIKQADNDLQDFRHAKRGDMPVGFEWSEDGTHWYPANARIDGERIILWSENGTQPWGIRYGHFNYGKVNVYNRAGLPLEPFCVKLDGLAGTQWSMSLLENQDTGAPQKD